MTMADHSHEYFPGNTGDLQVISEVGKSLFGVPTAILERANDRFIESDRCSSGGERQEPTELVDEIPEGRARVA